MTAAAVGNDVVDLTGAAARNAFANRRFVERVCDDDEVRRVRSARDLWTLFAAKEAAYKALVKLGTDPGFRHRSLHVALDGRSVCHGATRLALSLTGDVDHVHALAWTGGPTPVARLERTDGGWADESRRARALLCALVADAASCELSELQVVRDRRDGAWDGFGPPRVERAGRPIEADVSLSHDGEFVAAAALLG
jgi:phosphopantetheinyl transferase (holo-ACP synthase)